MACDSLYGAWLKAYHPYEFYATILKLYTEKGNKKKVALIIAEMKKAFGISLNAGTFGQDNRDWYIDKENHTISQSMASIKFMSPQVAEDLHRAGLNHFDSFSDLLWYLRNNSTIDSRQIQILIGIGYFAPFGRTAKLMAVANEFYKGKYRLASKPKSWESRLQWNRENESAIPNEELNVLARLSYELENTGLCSSRDRSAAGLYFVTDVDDKYKVVITLYNVARGELSPPVRMKKSDYASRPVKAGDCLHLWGKAVVEKNRYSYRNGVRTKIPGTDYWLEDYRIITDRPSSSSAAA